MSQKSALKAVEYYFHNPVTEGTDLSCIELVLCDPPLFPKEEFCCSAATD